MSHYRNRIRKLENRLPQTTQEQPTIDAARLSTAALRETLDNRADLSRLSPETISELHAAKVSA